MSEQLVPTQRCSSFQTSSYNKYDILEAVGNKDERCVGANSSDAQEPFESDS